MLVANDVNEIETVLLNYCCRDSAVPLEAQAKETLEVNYYSLLRVCETLFPILKPDAQVINISSSAGHLSRIPSENIRKKFANPTLNIEGLNNLMNDFIRYTNLLYYVIYIFF